MRSLVNFRATTVKHPFKVAVHELKPGTERIFYCPVIVRWRKDSHKTKNCNVEMFTRVFNYIRLKY